MNADAKTRPVEKDSAEQTIMKLGRQIGLMKAEINRLRRGMNAMAQRFEPW